MFDNFKLVVIGLKIARNTTSIAKSLASLAETSQLRLKLDLIKAEMDLDSLKSAHWETPEDDSTQIVFDSNMQLAEYNKLEAEFIERYGYEPDREWSLEQLAYEVEKP